MISDNMDMEKKSNR